MTDSNLFQILATFALGFVMYSLVFPLTILKGRLLGREGNWVWGLYAAAFNIAPYVIGVLIFFIIWVSFLFDIGETYQYSLWYKRSFGPFGDGIPFFIIVLLAYGFLSGSVFLASISLATLVLAGGRAVLASSLLVGFFLCRFVIKVRCWKIFGLGIGIALLGYFSSLVIANYCITEQDRATVRNALITVASTEYSDSPRPNSFLSKEVRGQGVCKSAGGCFSTQVIAPLEQRVVTSLAGLWMTLQGGFEGKEYPGTAEKFANFMMAADPWGINGIFDMSWIDWYRAGGVQNPFLSVGSGYGPIGLVLCLGFFVLMAVVGFRNMVQGVDRSRWSALTIYLVALVFLNQSQPWIQAGSLLLCTSGFAVAHILAIDLFLKRNWRAV